MAKTSKQTFDTIINTIKSVNKQWDSTLYSFTQGKDVKVSPMTVGQQRSIITASYNSKATAAFTTDIIDEVLLQNVDTSGSAPLTILDRPLMLLEMRKQIHGDSMDLTDENDEVQTMKISEHIKRCKDKIKMPDLPTEFIVNEGNISVTCSLPTIKRDRQVNAIYFDKYNPTSDNREIMHELIGDAFVFEITKYIKAVELHGEVVDIVNNTEVDQSISIVETLPYPLSTKISKKIEPFKSVESKLLTHEYPGGSISIPIDSSMFIGE